MSSRMRGRQPHRHSGEMLREVVSAVVPEEEQERYLVFARELYATLRHARTSESAESRIQRPEPRVRTGDHPQVTQIRQIVPFPDFTRRTKRVVLKWFRRGLRGNLMWRIGVGLLGRRFHDSATGKVAD
ncbi:hypothetical protein FJY68_00190 [candidate division WOR-3 bacterium]|uniref:Uncharacterized protein n=1 Tax=candidate division WOR-3 bacterium TaxID=2052148 RepID=A0A938BS77_UNCW3|nr:hypothetical protein [candidate division WOR-3 bacterium]